MDILTLSINTPEGEAFRLPRADGSALTPVIRRLRAVLGESGHLFIVGGYLRRVLRARLEDVLEPVGDLDIIVDMPGSLALSSVDLPGHLTRNVFGGYRWHDAGSFHHVDVWHVRDHYSVRRFGREPTIEAAMLGFPLNIDRAAFDPEHGHVLDGGLLAGVRERLIRFDAVDRYLEHIQAARAVLLQEKTSYRLDESVLALLRAGSWRGRTDEIRYYLRSNGLPPGRIGDVLASLERLSVYPS